MYIEHKIRDLARIFLHRVCTKKNTHCFRFVFKKLLDRLVLLKDNVLLERMTSYIL